MRRGAAAITPRRCCRAITGVLQTDGYAAYRSLADPKRAGGPATLAFCWAHWRRQLFDIAKSPPAPIAAEALKRIAELYQIEAEIRGNSADERRAVRQRKTKPLADGAEDLAREDAGPACWRLVDRQGHPLWSQPLGRAGALPR